METTKNNEMKNNEMKSEKNELHFEKEERIQRKANGALGTVLEVKIITEKSGWCPRKHYRYLIKWDNYVQSWVEEEFIQKAPLAKMEWSKPCVVTKDVARGEDIPAHIKRGVFVQMNKGSVGNDEGLAEEHLDVNWREAVGRANTCRKHPIVENVKDLLRQKPELIESVVKMHGEPETHYVSGEGCFSLKKAEHIKCGDCIRLGDFTGVVDLVREQDYYCPGPDYDSRIKTLRVWFNNGVVTPLPTDAMVYVKVSSK